MAIKYVHTNIISQNWRHLAAFYQEVFDCEPVPPERKLAGDWLEQGTGVPDAALEGMHLKLPGYGARGPTLEIYQYQTNLERLPPAANRQGLGHLAFAVDDVPATLNKVIAKGGSALGKVITHSVPGVGSLTFTYATDPDGNILELQHWD